MCCTSSPFRSLAGPCVALLLLAAPGLAHAEGSAQFGVDQDLVEIERNFINGGPQNGGPVTVLVDILVENETINIAVGNNCNGAFDNDVRVRVESPSGAVNNYLVGPGDPAFLPNCDVAVPGAINNPLRHLADEVGQWTVIFQNGAGASAGINRNQSVDPWDVTVTPPGYVGPVDPYNPPGGFGRVSALNWNLNANGFDNGADQLLYIVTDGGFVGSNYVWLLDLRGIHGFYYNLVANSLGVTSPTVQGLSGFSWEQGDPQVADGSINPQYPIYLNPPEVAEPTGNDPLFLEDFDFRGSSGVDQTFSPNSTPGVDDNGQFTFTTNLETFGTYAIILDINQNGVFDPYNETEDILLQDFAFPGLNTVFWDGRDPRTLAPVPDGAYDAQIYLRVGDFHFAGYDIEYMNPGIRILNFNEPDGVTTPGPLTQPLENNMYWNDSTLDGNNGGLSDVPLVSSDLDNPVTTGEWTDPVQTGVNSHAWGVLGCFPDDTAFCTDQSAGNNALVDTQVFGRAVTEIKLRSVVVYNAGLNPDDPDLDGDGEPNLTDPDLFDADADNDGLDDFTEIHGPDGVDLTGDETDPLDTDTDDDGISDFDEWNGTLGFVTHPGLPDSDQDGLWDGLELGLVAGVAGGISEGVFLPYGGTSAEFRPDDDNTTTTDPLDDDSDDDGLRDGTEDKNRSGRVDPVEADPNDTDSDGDGLFDGVEAGLAAPEGDGTDLGIFIADGDGGLTVTDPADDDTDDDGLPDGSEDANLDGASPFTVGGIGTGGSGETAPFLRDTDGDGLSDGLELGLVVTLATDTNPLVFTADLDPGSTTDPLDRDTDDGGVADGIEDANGNGLVDPGESDPNVFLDDDTDADGLTDADELNAGLDPFDADTDDDGAIDGDELNAVGLLAGFTPSDPFVRDSDGDGLPDGLEVGSDCGNADSHPAFCIPDPEPGTTTDPGDADTDDDGIPDGVEDFDRNGVLAAFETAGWLFDTDGDGLSDGLETGNDCSFADSGPACTPDTEPATGTDPLNPDSDGDGALDGAEDANSDGAAVFTIGDTGTAGSGETDPNDPDTDGDGLLDGDEVAATGPLSVWAPTSALDVDSDDGSIPDGAEVLVDGTDPNDPADDVPDADLDGIKDGDEVAAGLDPNDADTDDDGLIDGDELNGIGPLLPWGASDPLNPDSDGDGLSDGLEAGTDCAHPDSGATCVADLDPGSVTSPNDIDTDDDGLDDGVEDANGNGTAFPGEPDPALFDTDGDGLSDGLELGTDCSGAGTGLACVIDADPGSMTDPAVFDTDGDGLADGAEDSDGDGAWVATIGGTGGPGSGETDPNDPDTDADGLTDGGEVNGTGPQAVWGPTDALDTDTDDGGIDDGREVTVFGTNPLDPSDDLDTDGDGLSDFQEGQIGTDPGTADTDGDGITDDEELILGADGFVTDPLDEDSDDDGLSDGDEVNGTGLLAPFGPTDPTNEDSDRDRIQDGLEVGAAAALPGGFSVPGGIAYSGSDPVFFLADADAGATVTDPLDDDSDDDGLKDGNEDATGLVVNSIGGTGTSGSGALDPLAFDTDGDGISDGVESGLRAAEGAGTDAAVFRADADRGATVTDPLDTDTDDGGLSDGAEDLNADGAIDPGETDPNQPLDDVDSDGDGLSDFAEIQRGLDPNDPDVDDDGILDGEEVIPGADGLITDAFDRDQDDDGLLDGDEVNGTGPLLAFAPTSPRRWDNDGDGLSDGVEVGLIAGLPGGVSSGNGTVYRGTDLTRFRADADGGVSTTDPNDDDSDDDGLLDGNEDRDGAPVWVLGATGTAGSGDTDPNDADTDGDGLSDGLELGLASPQGDDTVLAAFSADADFGSTTTDPRDSDSDDGGVADGIEDTNQNGRVDPGERDPNNGADDPDSDGDGASDADEAIAGSDPADTDTDDDGLLDGEELAAGSNPVDADSDDDGLLDGDELNGTGPAGVVTDPIRFDTDGDGLSDGQEQGLGVGVNGGVSDFAGIPWFGTDPAVFLADLDPASRTHPADGDSDDDGLSDGAEDVSLDGVFDVGETDPANGDTDADGIQDGTELGISTALRHPDTNLAVFIADVQPQTVTDPLDDDSDDDGLLDGSEDRDGNGAAIATVGGVGSPGMGETDPGNPDSDGDGLHDGLESGLAVPEGTDTDPAIFVPDADPLSRTDPLDRDSDDGGLWDGFEDLDANGLVDPNETDPNDPADDASLDSDADLLPDFVERELGLDPFDADTDDDGLDDGVDGITDHDGDGLVGAADFDSDDDGLSDGLESGLTSAGPDTDPAIFVPDGNPLTRTDVNDDDSDDDGILDGLEDIDGNGAVDLIETDPEEADSDGDGLSDGLEIGLRRPQGRDTAPASFVADVDPGETTDPLDDDTDDDGLLDGTEDANGNGRVSLRETDPNVPDTDGDGVQDGTESGLAAPEGSGTDTAVFVPDADPSTTTDPLDPDTDNDGLTEGEEDLNVNGRVDEGETDPNNPLDPPRDGDQVVSPPPVEGCDCSASGGPSGAPVAVPAILLLLGLGFRRRR